MASGPTTWRSVTQIVDDETYLRLFKVMTDSEHAARLEATCSAIGRAAHLAAELRRRIRRAKGS